MQQNCKRIIGINVMCGENKFMGEGNVLGLAAVNSSLMDFFISFGIS